MGANRWIGWCRAICLYAGLALLTSCQPFYWMEDAHTLGKGRWKVDGQAYYQFWEAAAKEYPIFFYCCGHAEFGFSYGMTDRLDIGWMYSGIHYTGMRWKYNVFNTPPKHALSVGGRAMINTYFLSGNSLGLNWQTDLWYTRNYRWGTLTFNPSVTYNYLSDVENRHPLYGFFGLHAHLPLIDGQLTFQFGGSGGYPLTNPLWEAKGNFIFTGGVGMAYSFGKKR